MAKRPAAKITTDAESARIGGPGRAHIAIVVSRYNETITGRLLEGALNAYSLRAGLTGGADDGRVVIEAPGSFELPALCHAAAMTGRFDAVVAIGCLIKGETSHDRIIAEAVAHGLVAASIATGVPITFGVLTVDTPEQAAARAGGADGNKGADAMNAALDVVEAIGAMGTGGGGFGTTRAIHDKATPRGKDS